MQGDGALRPEARREVAPTGQGTRVGFGGGTMLGASELDVGEVGQGIGMVGGGGEDLAIAGFGLIGVALRFVGQSQVVEHAGMAGSTVERLPVMRDGAVVLTALALEVAQMEQSFGLIRIGGEDVAPGGLGLPGIALRERAARLGQQRSEARPRPAAAR